ncbi:hypothetical protein, partial [Actinoplanes lobatus]|uniref:hypothetical protein n=1 Tax=Actinoplanes lobatus TaxID=113568 RepID=UPI0019432B18
ARDHASIPFRYGYTNRSSRAAAKALDGKGDRVRAESAGRPCDGAGLHTRIEGDLPGALLAGP